MKFLKNMKKAKKDNKGFSLVELIIVIAIMAILVGIVGTQVIPYLNKSKVAKDQQILNSISTAAMTAYSENAELVTDTSNPLVIDVFSASTNTADPNKTIVAEIYKLSGFETLDEFKDALSSNDKANITNVTVTYTFSSHTIVTSVTYSNTPDYPIGQIEGTL